MITTTHTQHTIRAIFTPLLEAIDAGAIDPEPYEYGSRGPPSQDPFLASTGESCLLT